MLASYLQASPFFDKLVFSKIKARLGGKVRFIVTGGAPLATHVEEFLKVCFCCPVVQGFGLTETCAASCIAIPNRPVRGVGLTHIHAACGCSQQNRERFQTHIDTCCVMPFSGVRYPAVR